MILRENMLATMATGENSLMDGMIKNDAVPFLLRELVATTVVDEETQEPVTTTKMEVVPCYLTSPTIEQAIVLQKELERILTVLDPSPACRCGEIYRALLADLYGAGENQGLLAMKENIDLWIQDADDAEKQVLAMYGINDPEKVKDEISPLNVQLKEIGHGDDPEIAEMQRGYARDRLKHLMEFQKAYNDRHRQHETLGLQKAQLLRKVKTLEARVKKFPKNAPHEVSSMVETTCPVCKQQIPVPIEVLFDDTLALENVSQVLFEAPWVEMRKKVPYSMIKVMLTAIYIWGFKPMSEVQDPFVENMSEILDFVKRRIPKLRNAIPPAIAGSEPV